MDNYKKCPKCQETKSKSEFSLNISKRDGFSTHCKLCKAAYQKDWYEAHKDAHIDRAAKRRTRVVGDNRHSLYLYLLANPCVDCGEKDPIVLEFDHVRGTKIKEISRLSAGGGSWEKVLREINKCEVRCANCHRRVTAQRQGWNMLKYVTVT